MTEKSTTAMSLWSPAAQLSGPETAFAEPCSLAARVGVSPIVIRFPTRRAVTVTQQELFHLQR